MKTTLNKIRKHEPCSSSWDRLLKHLGKTKADDDPLEIKTILDALGIEDAVWALRAVDNHDKEIRLFACDCAENVLNLFEMKFPNDNRPRKAIETARQFANGECNEDELNSAWDAATWSAGTVAWSASLAARAAAETATWSARTSEKEEQVEFLMKYI